MGEHEPDPSAVWSSQLDRSVEEEGRSVGITVPWRGASGARPELAEKRRVADDDIEDGVGDEAQAVTVDRPTRAEGPVRGGDGVGIDVDTEEVPVRVDAVARPDALRGRDEEPAVATRGVKDAEVADGMAFAQDRVEHGVEYVGHDRGRRVPSPERPSLCLVHWVASLAGRYGARPVSRYEMFTRPEWAKLRAATPLTLTERDLENLRGINERISLDEVADVYLPLSRLLNLYVAASQTLQKVTTTFIGTLAPKVPYVIGMAGSVAVGKSTSARLLQALLSRWPDHPQVDLVTTDGFLFPNAVLDERGLMNRKGFPESYDVRRLVAFLRDVKSGEPVAEAPLYSHVVYDVVADTQIVSQPDILILEGINVLQIGPGPTEYVSDFFDFSIYLDAEEDDIEQWYVDRFLTLCETVFQRSDSFFNRFSHLSHDEAIATARGIWREINGKNLAENILPTRERASLILRKGAGHSVTEVLLRKL